MQIPEPIDDHCIVGEHGKHSLGVAALERVRRLLKGLLELGIALRGLGRRSQRLGGRGLVGRAHRGQRAGQVPELGRRLLRVLGRERGAGPGRRRLLRKLFPGRRFGGLAGTEVRVGQRASRGGDAKRGGLPRHGAAIVRSPG